MWKFCGNISRDGLVLLFKKTSENSYKENPIFLDLTQQMFNLKEKYRLPSCSVKVTQMVSVFEPLVNTNLHV